MLIQLLAAVLLLKSSVVEVIKSVLKTDRGNHSKEKVTDGLYRITLFE
jgi:hypothetical protein